MSPRLYIVKRVHDHTEPPKERHIEAIFLHVGVVRLQACLGTHLGHRLSDYLCPFQLKQTTRTTSKRRTHLGLRLTHMMATKQKLAVQIADVDRIQVDLHPAHHLIYHCRATQIPFKRTTSILLNPVSTRFFKSSQPMPLPADVAGRRSG